MNSAQAEAAKLRLQHLHTIFLHVSSPNQLTEAMAEGGSIYYELLQLGMVPYTEYLLELGKTGEKNAGSMQTEDVASHAYLVLWQQAADMFGSRIRLLTRPAPDVHVPNWQIRRSTQALDQAEPTVTNVTLPMTDTVRATNWEHDFAQQGLRYAMFVSEVLAEMQHGTPQAAEVQPQADSKTTSSRKRTDPGEHVNKLRQKIENGYKYPGSYAKLQKDVGGSVGTWTNIFAAPDNADLVRWRDNRSVYARNSPAAEQAGYVDEEYLPDEDIEKLYAAEVKKLPMQNRSQAMEEFQNLDQEAKRRLVHTLTRS